MKKNKKLFAILTLVAFMMTLVPALAFAAGDATAADLSAPKVEKVELNADYSVKSTTLAPVTAGNKIYPVTASSDKYTLAADAVETTTVGDAAGYVELAAGKTIAAVDDIDASKVLTAAAIKTAQEKAVADQKAADKAEADAQAAKVDAAAEAFVAFVKDQTTDKLETFRGLNAAAKDAEAVADAVNDVTVEGYNFAKVAKGDIEYVANPSNTTTAITAYLKLQKITDVNSDKEDGKPSKEPVDFATSGFGFNYSNMNKNVNTEIALGIMFNDAARLTTDASANLVIWAEEEGGAAGTPATGFKVYTDDKKTSAPSASTLNPVLKNAYYVTGVTNNSTLKAEFARSGKYTVYAAIVNGPVSGATAAEAVKNMTKITNGNKTININGDTANPKDDYRATVKANGKDYKYLKDGEVAGVISVTPNNVAETNVKVTLNSVDKAGQMTRLVGKTVNISSNSANLVPDKETATTDYAGAFDFNLSGSREGIYYVYVNCEGFEIQLKVQVGNTAATYITVASQPDAPVALFGGADDMDIRVDLTDVNGNVVRSANETTAPKGAESAFALNNKYVSFLSKPAGTILTNDDLALRYNTADENYYVYMNGKTFDKEGTYEIKIVLDNGNYVTVPFEVKRFETPVSIQLDYEQTTIELAGKSNVPKVKYIDANGTKQDASKKVTLAGTGYAISNFANNGQITVKNDEKYVGQTITVTAVDSRYNLTATTTLLVAEEAQGIAFDTTAAQVNVNNKIGFKVVDSNGNTVSLGTNATVDDVQFIILDKPEDAKVSAVLSGGSSDLKSKGTATMALTSNKVGDVKVQVLVKATVPASNTSNTTGLVTKYYTGTETFKVGKEAGSKTQVVMSIGSHELVKNGVVSTIDAAPMIQDNRTFVPFRALAEAFGATVEFDATNNTVTAKLNGTTVVMTIGSSVMTVGDEAKTLDVAPFISGDRTMVPVRAVAEAFGFNVEATSNPDGTTADVVFTK